MNRIKELRLSANITQSELAEKMGVNQSAIGKYEREELEPNITTLKKLANFFKVSVDYIINFSDDFGMISFDNQSAELPEEERKLLETFRKLTLKNKMHVSAYATVRLEEQERGAGARA